MIFKLPLFDPTKDADAAEVAQLTATADWDALRKLWEYSNAGGAAFQILAAGFPVVAVLGDGSRQSLDFVCLSDCRHRLQKAFRTGTLSMIDGLSSRSSLRGFKSPNARCEVPLRASSERRHGQVRAMGGAY